MYATKLDRGVGQTQNFCRRHAGPICCADFVADKSANQKIALSKAKLSTARKKMGCLLLLGVPLVSAVFWWKIFFVAKKTVPDGGFCEKMGRKY